MKWWPLALAVFLASPLTLADDDSYRPYPSAELITSLPLEAGTRFQYVGSGVDRCEVTDCLCRVKPGTASAREKISSVSRRFSVFFSEVLQSQVALCEDKYAMLPYFLTKSIL